MNKQNDLMIAFIVFYIATLIGYWALPISDLKTIFQYTVMLSSLALATVAGVYALYKYGMNGSKSSTLLLLTTGMFCWFIGESIWTYDEYYLKINPFPSYADITYLMSYPLFFLALIREIRNNHINWNTLSKSLIFMMVITTILLITLVCYFGVFLAYSPGESAIANAIAIGYGVADLVLIISSMALVVLAWEFKGGALSRIWLSLFISFFLILIADILFAIFTKFYTDPGSFYRSLTDSIWILSYLLFANALFNFGIAIQSAQTMLEKLLEKKTLSK